MAASHNTLANRFLKHYYPFKQCGSALIIALLVMTIVAAASVAIALRQNIAIQRTALLLNNQQAMFYAEAINDWAIAKLKINLANSKHDSDGNQNSVIDEFPMELKFTINNATIEGKIIDAQGLFNLNIIKQPNGKIAFIRLIHTVQPDLTDDHINDIAEATQQWISSLSELQQKTKSQISTLINDADNDSLANNSNNQSSKLWDSSYFNQYPPYQAAHRLMANPSELRLIHGVTATLYQALQPYIIALPSTNTAINVNTAPPTVLTCLGDNLTLTKAELITQTRSYKLFQSISEFEKNGELTNVNLDGPLLTIKSQYFLVQTKIAIGEQILYMYSLLERTGNSADNKNDFNNTGNVSTVNSLLDNKSKPIEVKILWQTMEALN